ALKSGALVQFRDGGRYLRIGSILRERHVAKQRHPVRFDHLRGESGTVQGVKCWYRVLRGIGGLQVEGQAGLGIDQGGISTKDQAVEIRTLSAFYRRQIVCVRRRIYFAESVVGEALGVTGDPRRIQSLISASRVRRRVDLAIRNRGLKALSI